MAEQDDDGTPSTLRFTPLFHGYFEGSLMNEEVPTRYLFGWLIAQSQRPGANGVVDVPKSHIARTLNMGLEQVEQGIARLMRPDSESRCRDEEGRRIVPLDPENPGRGWRVVAFKTYKAEVHNALAASRMAAKRAHGKGRVPDVPTVPDVQKRSHDTKRYETKVKREGSPLLPSCEVTTEEHSGAKRPPRAQFAPPSVDEVRSFAAEKGLSLDADYFVDAYAQKGWMAGKVPMRDWRAAARNASRDGWTMRRQNGNTSAARAPGPPSRPPGVTFAENGSWITYRGERYDREPGFERRGIAGWYRSAPNAFGENGGFRIDGSGSMADAKWSPAEYVDFFRRHGVPGLPEKLLAAIGCFPSAMKTPPETGPTP